MILKQELPLVIQTCKLASLLHATKFQVSRNSSKPLKILDTKGEPYSSSRFEVRGYLHLVSVILIIIQYKHNQTISLEEAVLTWISLMAHVAFVCFIYVNETKPSEITFYMNSMFQFESIYENDRHIVKYK